MQHVPPVSLVRIVAVSGVHQSARAYAASATAGYETPFERALVVRLSNRTSGTVRFRCEQRACRFAPSDQPAEVRRVDTRSYDVDLKDGRAELMLTIGTDTVPGAFTVIARPLGANKRVIPGSAVRFELTIQ